MTKTEAARRTALENALMTLGFTRDESEALRRISLTLRRWFELECGIDGGHVERDAKTDKPYFVASASGRRWPVADRERGAMRRLRKIMEQHPGLNYYIQPDPRGAALYILRPGDVPAGMRVESCYTRGLCVY
jgi:hypothetical protein